MVEVKFQLTKKDFFWMGLIVVLLGIGFGYAFGGDEPAVMGHNGGEIEINDAFCNNITGYDCGNISSSTNSTLECVTTSCSTGFSCTAACPSGYITTGGGGNPNTNGYVVLSYPAGNSAWRCALAAGGSCYARCCKIN
jgi:hypothetical protein